MHDNVLDQRQPAASTGSPEGFVELMGRRCYRIADYDRMPPFFMTVVGSGDPWLFVSSTGGLTAGRVQPDSALFPYYTDDKVSEGAGRTGGLSLLRVAVPGGGSVLWEPFTIHGGPDPNVSRALYKDVLGAMLVFEETRNDLGLRMRVTWRTSDRFGIVRTSELANVGSVACQVELLDGMVNLLPAGIDVATQNRLSNLLDAYKRSEVDPATGLGMYWLSSRLTDLAEPSESLQANVAWHVGLDGVGYLACGLQLPAFRRGEPVVSEHDVRAERGAYLVHARLTLAAGEARTWNVVGDVEADAADVVALRELLGRPDELAAELDAELQADRDRLVGILAAADALQSTGEELATAHHLANVLFNVMRGGVPADAYQVEASDVRAFVAQRSPVTARRCEAILSALPAELRIDELLEAARDAQDPDLLRMALEYLPLTFSRRHGDPSRPWNKFQIVLRDDRGEPARDFQGNWRDIFQNWEALAWSFPEYLESMVAVFLDATTADGYNPYRISRSGIDWEVPEPEDPWSNIGYWSDHQIIYLLKLLETSAHFHPGRLHDLLDAAIFTHADVPYRIAPYADILRDPQETITFDEEHAARIAVRVGERGADGRLVHGADGDLVRVSLAEKLLLLLLAKLVNLVPDGGIWMNTQRPEWNDANNALVGRGLSVVTLAQLRRYLAFVVPLLDRDLEVTAELRDLLESVRAALQDNAAGLDQGFSEAQRRTIMDALGRAGSDYRSAVYAGFSGSRVQVSATGVQQLLSTALQFVDASLASNRRDDALYHSYNLLDMTEQGVAIRRLPEMLEGQVAMLSSGLLDAEQSLALLAALRSSRMYRADQHSYMLYPDRDLPGFLSRNTFPAARAATCPLIGLLLERGDRRLVVADVRGDLHFAAAIRNARDIEDALSRLEGDPALAGAVGASRGELLAIFEEVFTHAEFTGRSGSFFAYEGLGSIYWHMVSKLLLAAQEALERALASGEPDATVAALAASYEDIRAGLGYCKPAATYGAFPTDPYSHTPAGHGARQPGMTGQVKEEVLTRLGELGLRVEGGCIVFRPAQLRETEWHRSATTFDHLDVSGARQALELPEGSLAFTFCQVPVVYRQAAELEVTVHLADGSVVPGPGGRIPEDLSAAIFRRTGRVVRIEVGVPQPAA